MAVVGTLTVDLVANTATFTADLGKAGNSLDELGRKAKTAGKDLDYSMREAKGGMMLVSEELGVHIPRHLQALIAQVPMVGAAFAEMLPIIGVIAAIAIIEKLIAKNEEAKEKLAQGWDKFGVESATVFEGLDDKMLKVGKTADELAGRHLAALRKELELIDHASLRELATEFGKLEKAGHTLMTEMKSSWYEIISGSQGAENALTRFTGEYDLLLAKGDKKGAFDKLVGTLASAKKALDGYADGAAKVGDLHNDKWIQSQRLLVSILEDQLKVTKEVEDINAGEKKNANTGEAQAEQGRQQKVYDEQQKGLEMRRKAEERYAKEQLKAKHDAIKEEERLDEEQAKATEAIAAWELKVQEGLATEALKNSETMAKLQAASEMEAARHRVAIGKETAEEAVEEEVNAAQKMTQVETSALDQQITSLNKHDAEYLVKLKQFEDKKAQVIRQGENEVTKIRDTAAERQFQVVERAELKMGNAIARTTSRSIIEGQNMAAAFTQLSKSMAGTAMDNLIQLETIEGRKKLLHAKGAAVAAFHSVMEHIPEPQSAVLAPIAAGVAFAGVMAFEQGGRIPGMGPQPIIGHGGETVVTKALTDRVEASEGRGGRQPHITNFHIHGVKDVDGFKASQSQIISKQQNAQDREARRNGKR